MGKWARRQSTFLQERNCLFMMQQWLVLGSKYLQVCSSWLIAFLQCFFPWKHD
uniref:Putative aconitate hydratase cytoplasmic n=1 Tax=Rhizophora mucronata TaxID=61149 RepID=A0A2P2IPC7_RHIMU